MMAVILFWMVLSAQAPADCPGWLGLGFLYHPPGHGHADGWMYVQQLAPGGPSARGGVMPGDVVSAMNGQRIRYGDEYSLMQRLSRVRPGETVRLTIHRGTRVLDVGVKATTISAERCRAWRDDLVRMQPKHR
jgi:S1-C subfamily serine protease